MEGRAVSKGSIAAASKGEVYVGIQSAFMEHLSLGLQRKWLLHFLVGKLD